MRARLTRFNLIKIYSEIKTRYEMGGMMDRSLTGEKHLVMPIKHISQVQTLKKPISLSRSLSIKENVCVFSRAGGSAVENYSSSILLLVL